MLGTACQKSLGDKKTKKTQKQNIDRFVEFILAEKKHFEIKLG